MGLGQIRLVLAFGALDPRDLELGGLGDGLCPPFGNDTARFGFDNRRTALNDARDVQRVLLDRGWVCVRLLH